MNSNLGLHTKGIVSNVSAIKKGNNMIDKTIKAFSGIDSFNRISGDVLTLPKVANYGHGLGELLPLYTVTYIDHWINSAKVSLR